VAKNGIDIARLFPPASEAEWRSLLEIALGNRPFESLISTTFEGLKIEPLYPRAAEERARALRQHPGPWKISQRMDHPDPETAKAVARADLEGGADTLTLTVAPAHAARGFGVEINGKRDLEATLAGVELDLVQLRLDAGPKLLDLAPHFASIARARCLTAAALDVDFGHDPIGHLARSGSLSCGPAGCLRETHTLLRDTGFAGHLLLADGRPYHEAGAGEAQELACVIATGVEYLRLLEAEGFSLEEAQSEIAFLLAADADEFLSLAKFRVLRLLWARIESACGLKPKPIRLHAETSFRMMTRYDPWVNILRTATGVFAAGVGSADIITALPFTLALGLPDEFARRIARNTQLILIYEAKVAKVADPAAGAGSFEALTEELCTRAWSLFQSFEAHGGMTASLRVGLPQKSISVAAEARREAIARRTLAITGTSAFPLLSEAPVNVLVPSPVWADERPAGQDCPPLRSHRDAEPYERLRSSADEHLRKSGGRPKIFLANLEAPQGNKLVLDYAANFFAAAGIEALRSEGFEAAQEAADAFRASGCKIACICALGGMLPQRLVEAARALRAAGAARIYLVKREPGEAETALLAAGANEFICIHCDALAILKEATATALREQPS
jgi:methylmalonyl-CoA mutase